MSFDKPKHSLPKLEDTESGDTFAFNFAPNDKYQCYHENSIRRPHEFKRAIQLLFKKIISPYASYDCYIEISPTSRLHIHGKIILKDPIGFYMDLHKLMDCGTVVVKFLQDDGWDEYITKQKSHWLPFDTHFTSKDPIKLDREILIESFEME